MEKQPPVSYEALHDPEVLRKHTTEMISFDRESAWKKIDVGIRRRRTMRRLSVVAAILLPLLVIPALIRTYPVEETMPVMTEVVTGRGEERTIVLPDGTSVILNSLSRITYPGEFYGECREVSLEGEALFIVTTTNIPFIVSTESMRIEDESVEDLTDEREKFEQKFADCMENLQGQFC